MDRKALKRNGRGRLAKARPHPMPYEEPRSLAADPHMRARQEQLLDEGIEETFPASDPVAVVRLT